MIDLTGTGHTYQLFNVEHDDVATNQHLQFIEKEQGADGVLKTVRDGTTTEDVLAVLIDRVSKLQAKSMCRENAIAITKLEEAMMWLDKRTHNMKKYGVGGTAAK